MLSGPLPDRDERPFMTWEESASWWEAGWHIGAHTVITRTCPLSVSRIRLERRSAQSWWSPDATIERRLGIRLVISPYRKRVGAAWRRVVVMLRYRFGRLWIIGSTLSGRRRINPFR